MNTEIGNRLKELRKLHKYSQQEVSDKISISRSTYAGYENSTPPDVMVLMKISKLYDVTTDYLLFGIKEELYMPCDFKTIVSELDPDKSVLFWLHLIEYARYLSIK